MTTKTSLNLFVLMGLTALASSFAQAKECKAYFGTKVCIGDHVVSMNSAIGTCEITEFTRSGGLFSNSYETVKATCENGREIDETIWSTIFLYLNKGCYSVPQSKENVCVGEKLIMDGGASVKVIGVSRDRSDSTPFIGEAADHRRGRMGLSNLTKKGFCFKGLCPGDRILFSKLRSENELSGAGPCSRSALFNDSRENFCKEGLAPATVESISLGGMTTIVPEGGNNRPQAATYFPTHLVGLKGCSEGLCVGQKVTTYTKREAVIEGINLWNNEKTFVIRFSDNNKLGEDWKRSDLK